MHHWSLLRLLQNVLITNGIHKNEFLNSKYQNYDKILNKYEAITNYYQEKLIW